ncbi:MAG: PAS domain-containing protein [Bacteroidota bacterium]
MPEKLEEALEQIKSLEKILEENVEKGNELMKLIESLEDQIFCIQRDKDNDFIITFAEGKVAENYQLSTAQVRGRKIRNIIGEELYATLEGHYAKAFEGEVVKYRGFTLNNRYYSTVLSPFKRNEDGVVCEIIGNTTDITEQYFTEEKFKESTEILNYIIDLNPYGIQICNAKGYHIRENKAFLDLFVFPPPPQWSLFNDPSLTQSGFNEKFMQVTKGEKINTPPIWYNAHLINPQCPDKPICIGSSVFPVFLADGKLENIVLMFEDITNRVKAEEDIIKRIEELEAIHDSTVNRELKMRQMEEEIEDIKRKLKN